MAGRVRRQCGRTGIIAAALVLVSLSFLVVYLIPKASDLRSSGDGVSGEIRGLIARDFAPGTHVRAPQRVAYDQTPPYGGPHDEVWATCTGIVYRDPIRPENALHSLEHGAVWLTYAPAVVGDRLQALSRRVDGQPYTMLSPYPGLGVPVTLQAWGRQLAVYDVEDPRIDRFISTYRLHVSLAPEPGASCAAVPGAFDPMVPPPFDPTPAGPDAVPMPETERSRPSGRAGSTPDGGDGTG